MIFWDFVFTNFPLISATISILCAIDLILIIGQYIFAKQKIISLWGILAWAFARMLFNYDDDWDIFVYAEGPHYAPFSHELKGLMIIDVVNLIPVVNVIVAPIIIAIYGLEIICVSIPKVPKNIQLLLYSKRQNYKTYKKKKHSDLQKEIQKTIQLK